MGKDRLLFTNAQIVLPNEVVKGSLAIEDGKIAGILEPGITLSDFTEVDVRGKTLMPGVIDTHVHMWDPSPLNYREDWNCGSQCAASGGITTIVDMPGFSTKRILRGFCFLGRTDSWMCPKYGRTEQPGVCGV